MCNEVDAFSSQTIKNLFLLAELPIPLEFSEMYIMIVGHSKQSDQIWIPFVTLNVSSLRPIHCLKLDYFYLIIYYH